VSAYSVEIKIDTLALLPCVAPQCGPEPYLQITSQVAGNSSSCTNSGTTIGCKLPFDEKYTVNTGDEIKVILDFKLERLRVDCIIYVNLAEVGHASVAGIGTATCDAIAGQ